MTLAQLFRHAKDRPDAVAAINNGAPITYAAAARSVDQLMHGLRAFGLRSGNTAAIQCGDSYLHLLLILACQGLGVATAAFNGGELAAPRPLPLFGQVDIVLTEQPDRIAGARRVQAITRTWIESILAAPATEASGSWPNGPADPILIQRTSGTTGTPKRLLLNRKTYEGRVASWARILEITAAQRVLVAMPFTLSAAHFAAVIALRQGATVVFDNRIAPIEALILHRIDRVTLVPMVLREMLDRLPGHFVRPPNLTITTVGGKVPPALRRRALESFATRVRENYSGNEIGNTALLEIEADVGIGTIYPGVRVEIVDENDKVLPHGRTGRIRVRSDYMIDAYLDDPEASARMFRDGWFYPGDVGILHDATRLEVSGRDDEILNIGGHKVMPADLEEKIRGLALVDDIGVCLVPNAEGIDEVWVAAVYNAPDHRDIAPRLEPGLRGYPFGAVRLIKLARIPRTETGKIVRAELRHAVIEAAKAHGMPIGT